MGTHSEQHSAARQFYADAQPVRSAREVCEEDCDDAMGRMIDEWAERLVRRGVARILAQRCAEVVVEEMRGRDAACAGARGGAASHGLEMSFGGLFARSIEQIVEANNSKFAAGCLLLALGNKTFARSARQWAELRGMSHESAANTVELWQERMGLPRTSGQKSAEAVESYKLTNGKRGRNAA